MRAIDALLPRDGENRVTAYRAANGADYGAAGGFGAALATVAQAAKLHPGLVAAQVDLGGWDTHDGQSWRMTNQVRQLSRGLAALDADLADLPRRWTVLVASEFGRRLRANANGGTDHGRAGTIMAFGRGGALGGISAHGRGCTATRSRTASTCASPTTTARCSGASCATCRHARRRRAPPIRSTHPIG